MEVCALEFTPTGIGPKFGFSPTSATEFVEVLNRTVQRDAASANWSALEMLTGAPPPGGGGLPTVFP